MLGLVRCSVLLINNTDLQESPAWPQEVYRPPCSEYSFCCPILADTPPPGRLTPPPADPSPLRLTPPPADPPHQLTPPPLLTNAHANIWHHALATSTMLGLMRCSVLLINNTDLQESPAWTQEAYCPPGLVRCSVLLINNTDLQESPAWTQEAYRPPCSEYSFCCPILADTPPPRPADPPHQLTPLPCRLTPRQLTPPTDPPHWLTHPPLTPPPADPPLAGWPTHPPAESAEWPPPPPRCAGGKN